MFRFSTNALRDDNDRKDPRASVLLQESFENLPTCLFIVAELDPLRDDSYGTDNNKNREDNVRSLLEYQKKLEQAGVKTKLVLVKEVIHSFFSLPGKYWIIE